MSDLLITNVDVLTNEGVLKNHAIEIENGYITAILKDSEAIKVKDYAKEVLDGKGQLAAPGLVNTHTHIAMGLFRNYADDLELMEWLKQQFGRQKQNLTTIMFVMALNLALRKCCALALQPLAICISL